MTRGPSGRATHAPRTTTVFALTLAAVLTVGIGIATAQTVITFTDFSDKSSLQLNGSTAANNPSGQTFLRLTSGNGQAGSAFLIEPIELAADASFSTNFAFRILNPTGLFDTDGVQGADGIVFVVQTDSASAGGGGGGIGYDGLEPSVGIEFDTWNNGAPDNNNGNHVGINVNGETDSLGTVTPITPAINDGSTWYAWVDYNGATDLLEVRLSQTNVRPATATTSATVDLPTVLGVTDAFVGFTSGTGGAGGDHDILSWTFVNAFNPVGLNEPPVANAGPDQSVTATAGGTTVTLNGTASTDPDGDTLTYTWTGPFTGGTATGPSPTVTFANAGSHTVTLAVNDGNGGTDTDEVVITVAAQAASPTAAPASPTPAPTTPTPRPSPAAGALPDTAAGDDAAALLGGGSLIAVALTVLVAANALAFGPRFPKRNQPRSVRR